MRVAMSRRRRRPRTKRPPYHPLHWPLWLVLGLLRLAAFLPYRAHLALGRGLGWLMRRVASRRIRIATWNVQRCFPELDASAHSRMIDQHFESLGIMTFETVLAWWASDARLAPLARFEGWENVERALAGGKGVILLSAHFCPLEIGGRLFRTRHAMHPMYKPNRNVVIEHVMRTRRLEFFQTLIPMDDVRQLLRSLKANFPVWYAPDQGFLGKGMLMVPFFGIDAPTNTATSRLARMSGAPVVPYFTHRLPDGQGYAQKFLPALERFPTDDLAADALRINRLIEDEVRLHPAEYLWAHNRFKWARDGSDRRCQRSAAPAAAAGAAVAGAADEDQGEE